MEKSFKIRIKDHSNDEASMKDAVEECLKDGLPDVEMELISIEEIPNA